MNEDLIPVWIREYVEAKITERMGDEPPLTSRADSESALRGSIDELNIQAIRQAPGLFGSDVARILRSCAKTIMENRMDGPSAGGYLAKYADMICALEEPTKRTLSSDPETTGARFAAQHRMPTSGPPTEDLAAQPDSTTIIDYEYETQWGMAPKVQRIGVHDYASLVECLRANYQLVFPGEDWVDPQNMIQLIVAHIQELRKRLEERVIHEEK